MTPSFVDHLRHVARGDRAFPVMAGELVEAIPLKFGRLTIGRGTHQDLVLDDAALDREHAVVEWSAGGCFLADRHTGNGTFVNGKSIDRVRLQAGDLIHLGAYVFRFKGSHLLWVRQPACPPLAALKLSQATPEGVQLLDDVSLVFHPGEFVGLLGPSGAGKTTLLNALSGCCPAESGCVLLGGMDLYQNFASLGQALGYVPQNDLVHPELTSRQALAYVGRLRLPEFASAERNQLVDETLNLLDLGERAEVPIGKLSGGQRKRASVGVELLCKPAILFLDEPTSGLDPGTEARLMGTLERLANLGKTVVVTTHIMENVDRFDKIAILARGGKLAYFGPPREALEFFGAGTFLEVYERLEEREPRAWQEAFRGHRLFRKLRAAAHAERLPRPLTRQVVRLKARPVSQLKQWLTLTCRAARILVSDPRQPLLALVHAVLMGGLMCVVFEKLPVLAFLLIVAAFWFGCGLAAQQIVKERPIFRRERMVNLRLGPYVLSKFFLLASLGAAQCVLLLGVVSAWKGGLDWAIFLPTLLLSSWNGIGLGLVISACAANADRATALVPMVLLPQIILAGVLMPVADMNGPTRIAAHLAATKWANHAAEVALFDGKAVTADLLRDEANVWPVWNLYPDHELRTAAGRQRFLSEHGNATIQKKDDLQITYLVMTLFVVVQLAALGMLLRRQDAL